MSFVSFFQATYLQGKVDSSYDFSPSINPLLVNPLTFSHVPPPTTFIIFRYLSISCTFGGLDCKAKTLYILSFIDHQSDRNFTMFRVSEWK